MVVTSISLDNAPACKTIRRKTDTLEWDIRSHVEFSPMSRVGKLQILPETRVWKTNSAEGFQLSPQRGEEGAGAGLFFARLECPQGGETSEEAAQRDKLAWIAIQRKASWARS